MPRLPGTEQVLLLAQATTAQRKPVQEPLRAPGPVPRRFERRRRHDHAGEVGDASRETTGIKHGGAPARGRLHLRARHSKHYEPSVTFGNDRQPESFLLTLINDSARLAPEYFPIQSHCKITSGSRRVPRDPIHRSRRGRGLGLLVPMARRRRPARPDHRCDLVRVANAVAVVEGHALRQMGASVHRCFPSLAALAGHGTIAPGRNGCAARQSASPGAVVNAAAFVSSPGSASAAFDQPPFAETVALSVRLLDDVLLACDEGSRRGLRIGLIGMADAMQQLALPYDSPGAIRFAGDLAAMLCEGTMQGSTGTGPGARFRRE